MYAETGQGVSIFSTHKAKYKMRFFCINNELFFSRNFIPLFFMKNISIKLNF